MTGDSVIGKQLIKMSCIWKSLKLVLSRRPMTISPSKYLSEDHKTHSNQAFAGHRRPRPRKFQHFLKIDVLVSALFPVQVVLQDEGNEDGPVSGRFVLRNLCQNIYLAFEWWNFWIFGTNRRYFIDCCFQLWQRFASKLCSRFDCWSRLFCRRFRRYIISISLVCYVVISVINGTKIVKLRNPWGAGEWKGDWGDDWIVENANSKLRNIDSVQRRKLDIDNLLKDRNPWTSWSLLRPRKLSAFWPDQVTNNSG